MRRLNLTLLIAFMSLVGGSASLQAQITQLFGATNKVWNVWTNGTDPGYGATAGSPDWAQKTFNDSAWPTGRGLFGNDTGYPYPFNTITPPPSVAIRFYARTHFTWSGSTVGVVLSGTNYVDDGAVIYLNGVEISRYNMPAGATAFTTVALSAPGEPIIVPFSIELDSLTNGNSNPLVAGDNVIAVETASNASSSSDTVWSMALYGSQKIAPCSPGMIPASTNALQCRDVTLALNISGNCGVPTPTVQWYRDVGLGEELIAGATGNTLTLTALQPTDAGQYYARLSNTSGSADSAHATVSVTPDTAGPQIVSVTGVPGAPDQIAVVFNEPVKDDQGGVLDQFAWEIKDSGGNSFATLNIVRDLNNFSRIVITVDAPLDPASSYTFSFSQDADPIFDACAGNQTAGPLSGPVLQSFVLLAADDPSHNWRYNDTGVDPGPNWMTAAFDDSAWASGPGAFGAETATLPAPIRTVNPLHTTGGAFDTADIPSYYYRTTLAVPAGATKVLVRPEIDDGYILYVNGVEVHRLGVPVGSEGFASYSDRTVGDAVFEGPFELPIAAFHVGGDNLIAAVAKNVNATSSDIVFGLEVIVVSAGGIQIDPPVIVTQPANVAVNQGHSFTLSVVASGTQLSYQWSKDGTDIPGATGANYTAVADASAGGSYRVTVSNGGGSVQSSPATVTLRSVVTAYSASWKYDTASQDASLSAGTPWYAPGFDDSAWLSGPGPFGIETTAATIARLPVPIATALPAPSATFLTAYFRSTVTVPAVPAGKALVLHHTVDDGAIFYVDGVRALDFNAPTNPAPILSTYLAPASTPGDGDAREVATAISLSAGTHTIAVEVHQNAATSSDVVFGVELQLVPKLTVTRSGANASVTWTTTAGFSLFEAPAVTGPWTAVAGNPQGTYNVSNVGNAPTRFYQLR